MLCIERTGAAQELGEAFVLIQHQRVVQPVQTLPLKQAGHR